MLSYSSQFPMQSLNSNMGWDQIADLPKNMFWLRPDCRPGHKYVSFVFIAHASMCMVSQLTLVGTFCFEIFYHRQEVNGTNDMKINFTNFVLQNFPFSTGAVLTKQQRRDQKAPPIVEEDGLPEYPALTDSALMLFLIFLLMLFLIFLLMLK